MIFTRDVILLDGLMVQGLRVLELRRAATPLAIRQLFCSIVKILKYRPLSRAAHRPAFGTSYLFETIVFYFGHMQVSLTRFTLDGGETGLLIPIPMMLDL